MELPSRRKAESAQIPRASLANLPEELLLLLPPLLEKDDLSRLSRTCKRLRGTVLALVYQRVQWYWNTDNEPYPRTLPTPPIHLLLRTLMNNPELGHLIEEVDFQGRKNDPGTSRDESRH